MKTPRPAKAEQSAPNKDKQMLAEEVKKKGFSINKAGKVLVPGGAAA